MKNQLEVLETFHKTTTAFSEISKNLGRAAASFHAAAKSLKESADKINESLNKRDNHHEH